MLAGVACDLMANWPTPRSTVGGYTRDKGQKGAERLTLEGEAQLWTTSQAHDVSPRGSGQKPTAKAGNACLARDAVNWPTPAAHEPRLGVQNRSPGSKGQQLSLSTIADRFPRPAPGVAMSGPRSSPTARTMRPLLRSMKSSASPGGYRALLRGHSNPRLSPLFVEWLMGWPPGHALCDCSATGVHPLAAAYAFRTLAAAHGLGGMDLEATDREAGTGTDVASVAAE